MAKPKHFDGTLITEGSERFFVYEKYDSKKQKTVEKKRQVGVPTYSQSLLERR